MPLDMLITGRIATLGGDTGYGWVEAIGIRGGRIAFAGSEVDLETRADPFTERIRLEPDQVAIPGLTDAHLHLTQAALASRHVDLGDAATLDEGLARLRAAHERLPDGAWLEGHGWDADRWGGWPTADALEAVAPGRRELDRVPPGVEQIAHGLAEVQQGLQRGDFFTFLALTPEEVGAARQGIEGLGVAPAQVTLSPATAADMLRPERGAAAARKTSRAVRQKDVITVVIVVVALFVFGLVVVRLFAGRGF